VFLFRRQDRCIQGHHKKTRLSDLDDSSEEDRDQPNKKDRVDGGIVRYEITIQKNRVVTLVLGPPHLRRDRSDALERFFFRGGGGNLILVAYLSKRALEGTKFNQKLTGYKYL